MVRAHWQGAVGCPSTAGLCPSSGWLEAAAQPSALPELQHSPICLSLYLSPSHRVTCSPFISCSEEAG